MNIAAFRIRGTAPLVVNKFSAKAREMIRATQEAGSTARGKKHRDPKNFAEAYEGSRHIAADGWDGFPASAFRCATISACRLVGFKMTLAKLSLFIEADGFSADDSTPLVKITKGEPKQVVHPVRNSSGVVDLRSRAMFEPGWEMMLRVRFDSEQFTQTDIANLVMRVGSQVGIGEGRPDSRDGAGMGWGLFEITNN